MSKNLPYSTGLAYAEDHGTGDALIDLADPELFASLVQTCVQRTSPPTLKHTIVMVDATTAGTIDALPGVLPDLAALHIFGDDEKLVLPIGANLHVHDDLEANEHERFFVAMGPGTALAAALLDPGSVDESDNTLHGFWTTYSPCIEKIIDALVGKDEIPQPAIDDVSIPDLERSHIRFAQVVRRHYRASSRHVVSQPRSDLEKILSVMQAISAPGTIHEVLFVFVEQIAAAIDVDRCSCVRVRTGSDEGRVLASHDDESIRDQAIDLSKYPEVRRALSTGETIRIDDVASNEFIRSAHDSLVAAGITSILVVPVILYDVNNGSLFLRAVKRDGKFSDHDVNFCEIVAESTANAIERAHLIETIQTANDRLERLAITDGMTGLYNFRFFRDRLEKEFSRAARYTNPLSCVLYDVDDFKKLNDTYGHLQGDVVLKDISLISRNSFRQSDIVARYGGEEIVALLPHTGLQGALRQAERVRQEIEAHHFDGLPKDRRVTVSVGVAEIDVETMKECDDLVRAADESLYVAKEAGKNRVVSNQRKDEA